MFLRPWQNLGRHEGDILPAMALRLVVILAVAWAQILGPGLLARCTPRDTDPTCGSGASCTACACPCCEAPRAPTRPPPVTPDQNAAQRWLTAWLVPPAPRVAIPGDPAAPFPAVRAESSRAVCAVRVQSLLCAWLT